MAKITEERLQELLAKARARKAVLPIAEPIAEPLTVEHHNTTISNQYGSIIEYNNEQQDSINTVIAGHNIVVTGAAGTGKTTTMKGVVEAVISRGIPPIANSHKYLAQGTPGIVACAFTRRAVRNLKRALPAHLESNCITIHRLLEYSPVYYDIEDENGNTKRTMRFEATRNPYNPLPAELKVIIIDEASMVGTSLYAEIMAACAHKVQVILLGDIQQLPPIFGPAILGFKMLEWKTVELTEVYRQALESPIIRLAHRILSGKAIPHAEYHEWEIPDKLKLHPWKKKLSPELALLTAAKFLTNCIEQGLYNEEEDIILLPFNKAFGTIELNKHIGNYLARKHNRDTYEIIAGFNKHYYSVGDKVLYEKEDATIVSINKNTAYLKNLGKPYKPHSPTLDYWGHEHNTTIAALDNTSLDETDVDSYLESLSLGNEDRITEASHAITLYLPDREEEVTISKAAEVNSLLLGWAITIHKAQGSEWRKAFLLLHHSHNTMLARELLYTAVTRPREELYVICEPDSFTKGIERQRIIGNTIAEKAEYFKGKVAANELQETM